MSEHLDRAELEIRLWKEVEKIRFGMLGLVGGPPRHLQPMTAYADREAGALWFYTKTTTDLARESVGGHAAMFCVMAKDQEFQACIGGDLTPVRDMEKIKAFWNPVAAAWFPEGKKDPDLTLLRLEVRDAEVWVSRAGPVRFGWEIAKANATGREPDVGDKAHLTLI
jgi:general stress protein 26